MFRRLVLPAFVSLFVAALPTAKARHLLARLLPLSIATSDNIAM